MFSRRLINMPQKGHLTTGLVNQSSPIGMSKPHLVHGFFGTCGSSVAVSNNVGNLLLLLRHFVQENRVKHPFHFVNHSYLGVTMYPYTDHYDHHGRTSS